MITEWTRTTPQLIWQGSKGAAAVRLCVGRVVNVTADERVMADGKVDISRVDAIAFDPYTHGYYRVTERVRNLTLTQRIPLRRKGMTTIPAPLTSACSPLSG